MRGSVARTQRRSQSRNTKRDPHADGGVSRIVRAREERKKRKAKFECLRDAKHKAAIPMEKQAADSAYAGHPSRENERQTDA